MSVARDTHARRLRLAQDVLNQAEEKTARVHTLVSHEKFTDRERINVPEPLAALVPHGGFNAGSSIAIEGIARTSLALSLAATAAGREQWCALVGMPHVGLASLAPLGLSPERTVLVPDPREQAQAAISALIDGIGVLVLGPELALSEATWRTLSARARAQGSIVFHVPSLHAALRHDLTITAHHSVWSGLGRGSGRLRYRRLVVRASGRGVDPRTAHTEVLLPTHKGALARSGHGPRTLRARAPQHGLSLIRSGAA